MFVGRLLDPGSCGAWILDRVLLRLDEFVHLEDAILLQGVQAGIYSSWAQIGVELVPQRRHQSCTVRVVGARRDQRKQDRIQAFCDEPIVDGAPVSRLATGQRCTGHRRRPINWGRLWWSARRDEGGQTLVRCRSCRLSCLALLQIVHMYSPGSDPQQLILATVS
jgi:hypothetical protein